MKKKYLSVLSTTMTVLILSSQTFGAVKWNTIYEEGKNEIGRNTTIIGTYKFPNLPNKVSQYMEAARSIKEGEPTNIAVFNLSQKKWREKNTQEILSLPPEVVITNDGMDMLPAEGELLWDDKINIPFTSFISSMYDSAKKVFTVKGISYKLENPAATALVNDALEVLSNIKEDDVFKVENGVISIKSGGSGEDARSEAPKFAEDKKLAGASKSYKVGEKATTLEVDASVTDGGEITYTWYYLGDTPSAPASRANLPAATVVPGTGNQKTFTPPTDKPGRTFYYVEATNKTGDLAENSTQSEVAEIIVTEGELKENEVTVGEYVYNNESKSTETMGMIEGTALENTIITIESNYSSLLDKAIYPDGYIKVGNNGEWKATFPRQNAGTIIKVTATLNGKSFTKPVTVNLADDKALNDFRNSIDLKDLIEKRDKLYWSEDKGVTGIKAADLKKEDTTPVPVQLKSGDYWIDNKDSVEAFKAYVDLIEKVLDYKYQISDVDLKYMETIAKPTVDILNELLNQVDGDKVTTYELTLLVGGNKQGTVTIKDKDTGAIVGDTSSVTNGVYTINNGKTVTITAIPNAQNKLAGWSIDKEFSKDNNTTREEKVTKDISIEAVFASPEEAVKVDEVLKIVEEITNKGTKPVEVSIAETAPSDAKIKETVISTIQEVLPEGAKVKEVVLEEIPTRAITKNYTAKVTFTVGDVEFNITIKISVIINSGEATSVTASVIDTAYDSTNKGTKINLKLTPYVEGVTKADVTLTDKEGKEAEVASVTTAGTGENKYYEVLAKLTKDVEYTIKVTKDGYNISTAKVIGLDESGSTPTPEPVSLTVDSVTYDKTSMGTKINLKLTPYVEGVTEKDVTLTDKEGKEAKVASVTAAGTGEDKYYEVLAKLTKDIEYTVKVTKDGYDIATTTVKGLDVDSPTPGENSNAVQIKSFVIANDAEVNTSVEQIVYQQTVGESSNQAVYKIYAKLSNPVASFSVGDTSVKFNLDLSATMTKNNVTTNYPDLLKGLKFNNVTRVLMKELSEDNSKLEITLDLEGVGESEDTASTHTINFKWVEPNKAEVTGDPLKTLKFKAYKFKK